MSDFDKFFAEKLEEEAHYPGRAKNWRSLNQRLDAFVVGSSVGSAVGSVAWKAVSAVLLVTTAVLVWQYAGLQKEHSQMQQQQQKLEQQIAELQRPAAQQQVTNQQFDELKQPGAQQQVQNVEQRTKALQQQPAQQQKQQQNVEQQIAELQQQTARQSKQQQYLEQQIAQLRQQAASQSKSSQRVEQQIAEPQQPAAQRPSSPASSAVVQSTASQGAGVPPIFPEKKGDTVGAEQAAAHASPLTSNPSSTPLSANHPDSASSAVVTVPAAPATPDSTAQTAQLPPPDTSAKSAQAPPPPIIKPLRERFQLKAGMGVIVGWEQPRQQGISLITGQGISASLSLWRSSLWLTSGVDWVRFEEKSSTYRPEFHRFAQPPKSPKPGPGPHQHDELVSVESQQRQQRYHLGLRYALPHLLGVRPTVQAGHVWVRTAPTFVQYTFDDHDPGPGPNPNPNHKLDFLTQKEGPLKYSNIWQVGLGLEYDLRAWTLSLRADYQAQAKAVAPTFDALFLQAGLEYRIR